MRKKIDVAAWNNCRIHWDDFDGSIGGAMLDLFWVVDMEFQRVDANPMYWGNAFVGQIRQCIAIRIGLNNDDTIYIDNGDGTGLLKILRGGAPVLFHRGVVGAKVVRKIDDQNEWVEIDIAKYYETENKIKQFFNSQTNKQTTP